MRGDLRIPLDSIPDGGLDLDVEVDEADLEIEGREWPPLSGARLVGRLEATSAQEAVFRGSARGSFELECNLGLARFAFAVDEPVTAYFQVPSSGTSSAGEVELEERELEVSYIRDNAIDLLPPLRDQLGLAIPVQPKCPGECLGEEPAVCRRLKVGEGVGLESGVDPRWAALQEWKK
ncbi:MAG: DUF177 domain-containing protein [bacterium]